MAEPAGSIFDLCVKEECDAVERALARDPKAVSDYSQDGLTPLHIAAQQKSINLARRLLPLGADPNARATAAAGTQRGHTPMHFAAKAGDVDIMQMLFENGGSVKLQGHDGWTPLHAACFAGKTEAVRWLIDRKVSVNIENEHKVPPICFCANHGRLEATRLLVKAGARLDFADAQGDTVLHHAMHIQMFKIFEEDYKLPEAQIDVACILAMYGASIDAKNQDGWTPLHFCEEAFGGTEFTRVMRLISMNSMQLQAAEGTLTPSWNYMTLLSVRNRKVWEGIGIDPQQAKDLVDSLHAFEAERQKKKKDVENNPRGPCPFMPASKKKKAKNRTSLDVVVEDDDEDESPESLKAQGKDPSGGQCPFFQGSEDDAEVLRARGKGQDPSNGQCPFFQDPAAGSQEAPAESEQQPQQQQRVAQGAAVQGMDTAPAEPSPRPAAAAPAPEFAAAAAAHAVPAAAAAPYPGAPPPAWYPYAAPPGAWPPEGGAYGAAPWAGWRPPAAPAHCEQPPLTWGRTADWLYDNRTAVLCCIICFLLGMWWERKLS
eukprot:TRINITY_DN5947_c1_g1_i1.p1 TRINITY_DN5947_c1_g1~~TRINITY_DN5947_c1_g1_i1.p1  ORF type:complete len:570 (+),score=209.49 TRINITY_DN5947_c1_g1_i1:81-1712(+)